MSLLRQSEENKARYAGVLPWLGRLEPSHSLAWIDEAAGDGEAGARLAMRSLLEAKGYTAEPGSDLMLCRDLPGRPYIVWQGALERWARTQGLDWQRCHITNSHDGCKHLILAAYDELLAGIGIDVVYLPRLRSPELRQRGEERGEVPPSSHVTLCRDAAYLRRFARHFMSDEEWERFDALSRQDDEETLRRRTAAHFSLMEAASKALGLGLKIGVGMGHAESLPKRSLGALTLSPDVELLIEGPARTRLDALGVRRTEAYWAADYEFLVSVVLLWKG